MLAGFACDDDCLRSPVAAGSRFLTLQSICKIAGCTVDNNYNDQAPIDPPAMPARMP
jgi:hypothetical protein